VSAGRDGSWPSATTTLVGVIGDPVRHSLSPLLHNTAFAALGLDWVSVAFPVPDGAAGQAVGALTALGIAGLSVTMPHKAAVARLLDELTPVARRLGAVNCIVNRDGTLTGANTDGDGFLAALARSTGFDPAGRRCLVVGAGGAARAVVLALAEAGAAEVVVVARRAEAALEAAAMAGDRGRAGSARDAPEADLVVDATPVGMAGGNGGVPSVPAGVLVAGQVAVDLVYAPAETPWVQEAAARGVRAVGGLGMLVHQAAGQLELWTGRPAPLEAMWSAAEAAGAPG
jgi:shikimate dehydrogenase